MQYNFFGDLAAGWYNRIDLQKFPTEQNWRFRETRLRSFVPWLSAAARWTASESPFDGLSIEPKHDRMGRTTMEKQPVKICRWKFQKSGKKFPGVSRDGPYLHNGGTAASRTCRDLQHLDRPTLCESFSEIENNLFTMCRTILESIKTRVLKNSKKITRSGKC